MNRLCVLPFEKILKGIIEILFHVIIYQMLKYFNILIDGKSFFDLPLKNEEEVYKKVIEISKTNVYTTGDLLDFAYSKKIQTNLN